MPRCWAQALEYVLESSATVTTVATPPAIHGSDGDEDCGIPLTDSDTAMPKPQLQGYLLNKANLPNTH